MHNFMTVEKQQFVNGLVKHSDIIDLFYNFCFYCYHSISISFVAIFHTILYFFKFLALKLVLTFYFYLVKRNV